MPDGLVWNGGTFMDIGAHAGKYTVRLAPYFNIVMAWEPNPVMRAVLHENVEANSLRNVIVVPFAAWSSAEELELAERGGESTLLRSGNVHVLACRPDHLAPRDVTLIKIDVEGAEGHALAGLTETLRQSRPRVVVEMHDNEYGGEIRDAVRAALGEADYRWEQAEYAYGLSSPFPSFYWVCEPSKLESP
jgi:FkbM family methyltransferase